MDMLHTGRWPHPCDNAKVSDALSAVVEARDAYLEAREQVTQARLALGRAIMEAREQEVPQTEIARVLGLTREQIRRYQAEYEETRPQRAVRQVIERIGPEVRVQMSARPKFVPEPSGGGSPDGN